MQALLDSPLGLLRHLPCATAAPAPQQLRRAASMQALGGSGPSSPCSLGSSRHGSWGMLPRTPSLPAVQEHQPALPSGSQAPVRHCCSVPQLPAVAEAGRRMAGSGLPPRRSQSETALAALPQRVRAQRPQWLAELLHQPRQAAGWGVRSAASLQDLACRALCTSLVRRWREQHGGGRHLPAALLQAVEQELRWEEQGGGAWQSGPAATPIVCLRV